MRAMWASVPPFSVPVPSFSPDGVVAMDEIFGWHSFLTFRLKLENPGRFAQRSLLTGDRFRLTIHRGVVCCSAHWFTCRLFPRNDGRPGQS